MLRTTPVAVVVLLALTTAVRCGIKPREVDDINARLAAIDTQLASLETQNAALENKYNSLREKRDAVRHSSSVLNVQLAAVQAESMDEGERLRADYAKLELRVSTVEAKQVTAIQMNPVAFSAYSTRDQEVFYQGRLSYTTFRHNHSDAFNLRTGEFTAPLPGIYVFYFQTQSDDDHYASFWVNVGGRQVCMSLIFSDYDFGSGLAVAHMNRGEKAFIDAGFHMYYRANITSFVGFLLSPDP